MESINEQVFKEVLIKFEKVIENMEKEVISCCGLTFTQCNTVVEIGRSDDISLNLLADKLEVDKSTMSQTINKLVELQLVDREINSKDRRYVIIKLTEEGIKVYKKIDKGMKEHYAGLYSLIPEGEKSKVIDSLRLLTNAIQQGKGCNL